MEWIFYSVTVVDSVVLGFCKICSEIYLNGRKFFLHRTFLVSESSLKWKEGREGRKECQGFYIRCYT